VIARPGILIAESPNYIFNSIYRLYASQAFYLHYDRFYGLAGEVGKSIHATTLSVHASKPLIAVIQSRANALGISKSRFAAQILGKWATAGHPPVSEPDRLMQIAAKSAPASPKKKAS
jgi:hypothetical protein